MSNFDAKKVKNEIVEWIRDWFEQNGKDCMAVVGISGGKDSSVVAGLCCEALGFYGDDIEKMKTDILNKDFLNIQSVIPKELISEYLSSQCKLASPVKAHDGFHELNIIVDLGE